MIFLDVHPTPVRISLYSMLTDPPPPGEGEEVYAPCATFTPVPIGQDTPVPPSPQ